MDFYFVFDIVEKVVFEEGNFDLFLKVDFEIIFGNFLLFEFFCVVGVKWDCFEDGELENVSLDVWKKYCFVEKEGEFLLLEKGLCVE